MKIHYLIDTLRVCHSSCLQRIVQKAQVSIQCLLLFNPYRCCIWVVNNLFSYRKHPKWMVTCLCFSQGGWISALPISPAHFLVVIWLLSLLVIVTKGTDINNYNLCIWKRHLFFPEVRTDTCIFTESDMQKQRALKLCLCQTNWHLSFEICIDCGHKK